MPAAFTLVQWDKVGSCLHDIKERTTFDKNANHRVHYQSGLISWLLGKTSSIVIIPGFNSPSCLI